MHLKLHGAPLVLYSVNLAPLTFSSLEPLFALETAWHPSQHIDLTFFLFSFLLPVFFLIPFFSSFLPLSLFPFPFFFLFGAPLVTGGGGGPQAPPRYAPANSCTPEWDLQELGKDCNNEWYSVSTPLELLHRLAMLGGYQLIHVWYQKNSTRLL